MSQHADHEHDWRVNPHVILPTYPPQRELVCAICGATRGSGIPEDHEPRSDNPKEWPKWRG